MNTEEKGHFPTDLPGAWLLMPSMTESKAPKFRIQGNVHFKSYICRPLDLYHIALTKLIQNYCRFSYACNFIGHSCPIKVAFNILVEYHLVSVY